MVRGILTCVAVLMVAVGCASAGEKAAKKEGASGKRVYVYDDQKEARKPWVPEGFMPSGDGIALKEDFAGDRYKGDHSLQVAFQLPPVGWRGVYWLANGWKPETPGPNLHQLLAVPVGEDGRAIRLVFWAMSKKGASIQVKVGGITKGTHPDSERFAVATEWLALTNKWQRYELDLKGRDLSCVQGGFCVVANDKQNRTETVEFLLDEIYFESYAVGGKGN